MQAEGTQAGTAPPGRLPSPYLSSAGVYQVPGNAPTRCPVTGQRCPVNSGTPAKTDRATTPKPGNTTGQRPKTGVETGQPLPVARSLGSQLNIAACEKCGRRVGVQLQPPGALALRLLLAARGAGPRVHELHDPLVRSGADLSDGV